MSSVLAVLVPIALLHVVAWATPGPNHLAIVTASVASGRRAGLRAAWGVAAGAFVWALVAVSGIAAVFQLYPPLYTGLRVIGAVYLIFLGVNAFRSARRGGFFNLDVGRASPATARPFRTAFVVQMTNPKAVLFFGSILAAFIPQEGPQWLMGVIVLQIGLMGIVLNSLAALLFSSAPVMRGFQAAGRSMSYLFGVLFVGLGLVVAWDVVLGFL